MTNHYSFHPNLVLRTPRNPYGSNAFDQSVASNPAFLESLFLASPVLTDEISKLSGKAITEKKMMLSLNKYRLRAATRCTPFGLFSGCNVVNWANSETNIVLNEDCIKRHTRLDMHYACALAQHLALLDCIKSQLTYYPNNSLYLLGDELRYIEYKYEGGRRKHQISAVFHSAYLETIVKQAAGGITIAAMKQLLVNDYITDEDAQFFIDELLEAQVLVSELEPAITGDEFIYQIIRSLQRIYAISSNPELGSIISILQQVIVMLEHIDAQQVNHPDAYLCIQNMLKELEIPFEANKLFQTDTIKTTHAVSVDDSIRQQISTALEVLNRLSPVSDSNQLTAFAARFTERYENKEIPLLEALDTETGLGYPEKSGNDTTPLVDNVYLPQTKTQAASIQWGLVEHLLNEKLNAAMKHGHFTVELSDADLAPFKAADWSNLPPSMSVMFRLTGGEQPVFIESVSGSSAANLLGRFAHADKAIEELVNNITTEEQDRNPAIIFAEIIHLPESRIGNILLHPRFRQYEIPYLATASAEVEKQLPVADLMISVSNNQIVLRSKKLNKIIIPRLSTAHNYNLSALPVYHFLCDLQHQGCRSGLQFNWGSLSARFQFLPRVIYKNVILSAATWRFAQKHYQPLADAKDINMRSAELARFREQWQLPGLVVLAEGDHELLINLEDPFSVDMLLDAIKHKPGIELKEFLQPAANAVKDSQNNIYCNQFIAALVKKTTSYKAAQYLQHPPPPAVTERCFTPGSAWLYYKFYCGAKSADKILTDALLPLTEALTQEGLIDGFFFIRYNDPSFHIRFRFHLSDQQHLGKIMEMVYTRLRSFEQQGFIWKIQLDTYQRELERYGSDSIEICEHIFFHDSKAVLKMLELTGGDDREHIRWLWALRAIDGLLNDFEFSLEQKLTLLGFLKTNFLAEFNADKMLKTQLTAKYNDHRKRIESTLDSQKDDASEIKPLLDIIAEKSQSLKPLAAVLLQKQEMNTLAIPLSNLLCSFIHMLVNRTMLAKPRLHELVIYDMLYRYYFSVKARTLQSIPVKKSAEQTIRHQQVEA
jgi:lantibiotic biosynthesis protein